MLGDGGQMSWGSSGVTLGRRERASLIPVKQKVGSPPYWSVGEAWGPLRSHIDEERTGVVRGEGGTSRLIQKTLTETYWLRRRWGLCDWLTDCFALSWWPHFHYRGRVWGLDGSWQIHFLAGWREGACLLPFCRSKRGLSWRWHDSQGGESGTALSELAASISLITTSICAHLNEPAEESVQALF